MKKFMKWSWVVITLLSFVDIVYISIDEGFIEGKVWPFIVTFILGLYICYRNFILRK
jgi:hypothetical protein